MNELRHARMAANLSQEDLGKLINYSASHISAIENGTREPKPDYLAAVDQALQTGGLLQRVLRDLEMALPWLRDWILIERDARSLRWFEAAWVPGLFQTEAYARATLATEMLTSDEVDQLVASRLSRQSVLTRKRPPLVVAVLDESILNRPFHLDPSMQPAQLDHLVMCAELPHVQVHVVPTSVGMYSGLAGGFIIAEKADGGQIAHADSQVAAHIVERPSDLARLNDRWERIRGDALPRRQSLDLIKDTAKAWSSW